MKKFLVMLLVFTVLIFSATTTFAAQDLEVASLSEITVDAAGNQIVNVLFNKPVASKFLPHVNGADDWIRAVGGQFGYTEDDYKMFNDFLRSSVNDNIKINGKTIGEILTMHKDAADLLNVAVMTHFHPDNNMLAIYIENRSTFKMNIDGENTIEILDGFKSPMGDTMKAPQKWVYDAANKVWNLAPAETSAAAESTTAESTADTAKADAGTSNPKTGDAGMIVYAATAVVALAASRKFKK